MIEIITLITIFFANEQRQQEQVGAIRYYQMSAEERSAKDREQGHCGMPYDNTYAPDQGNAGVGINHVN